MRRLDTFVPLRTVAIVLVIAHHTGWMFGVGASLVLLSLAGYTLGRLHLPAILVDGRTGRIWALIAKLLVPLLPASLLIFAVHSRVGNAPHPFAILLYEKWRDALMQCFWGFILSSQALIIYLSNRAVHFVVERFSRICCRLSWKLQFNWPLVSCLGSV